MASNEAMEIEIYDEAQTAELIDLSCCTYNFYGQYSELLDEDHDG